MTRSRLLCILLALWAAILACATQVRAQDQTPAQVQDQGQAQGQVQEQGQVEPVREQPQGQAEAPLLTLGQAQAPGQVPDQVRGQVPDQAQPVEQAQAPVPGRYALVIGQAAYGGDALQTATADAAVVAQALRDQGFDVTELHDLGTADLAAGWQAFSGKLAGVPPGATVAVYGTGLAVQHGCDDWLLPVDAQIARAADVSRIALSMRRVMADLSRTGSTARMVLLDGARPVPPTVSAVAFPKGLIGLPAPAATAFGLSEEPHDMVPPPRPEDVNGSYALAVANMSKQPIADLDTFLREVRIQTHKQSEGQQTPWHSLGGLMPPVVLSLAADEPQIAAAAATLPNAMAAIATLGPEDAYWAAVWRNRVDAFTAFLASFATVAPPEQVARVREILAQLEVPDPSCAPAVPVPTLMPTPVPIPLPLVAPQVLPLPPAVQLVDVCPPGFLPADGYDASRCLPIRRTPDPVCPVGFTTFSQAGGIFCRRNGPPVPLCRAGEHPQWSGASWVCAFNPPPVPVPCPQGSFAKWTGAQWFCTAGGWPGGSTCPAGTFTGRDGLCHPVLIPVGGSCPAGQVRLPGMQPGTCTVPPPNAGDCWPGTVRLANGLCVPKTQAGCRPGQVAVNGACAGAGPVQGALCPLGQGRDARGACVPAGGAGQASCPLGQLRLANGSCIRAVGTAYPDQRCAPGQAKLPNGSCVGTGLPVVGRACLPGQARQPNGTCAGGAPATGQITGKSSCPRGEITTPDGHCAPFGQRPPDRSPPPVRATEQARQPVRAGPAPPPPHPARIAPPAPPPTRVTARAPPPAARVERPPISLPHLPSGLRHLAAPPVQRAARPAAAGVPRSGGHPGTPMR